MVGTYILFFSESWGRKPTLFISACLMSACFIVVTVVNKTTAAPVHNQATPAGIATVAMIFLFGATFSIGITPLQALYPVEVLSFEMRAKGMAFSSLAVSVGGLLNQFAWPISLAKIGWHTYIIFVIWNAVMFVTFYFFLPETRRRTLEELDLIFESSNPVKESLKAHKVELAQDGTVLASKEV